MNISHDKESGALYIRLRDGEYDHTEDLPGRADVYLDVDRAGNVLGLEALSFEDLAQAIEEGGGNLEVPERLWLSAPREAPSSDAIRAALSSLEPREQEILRLRFFEGLTARETAERLGISIAAAYRLHKAALTNLRAALYGGEVPVEDGGSDERSLEDALSLLASS